MARAKQEPSNETKEAVPSIGNTAKTLSRTKGAAKLSPEDITRIYQEYKQFCIDAERKLTFEGFVLRSGVLKDTMLLWLEGDDKPLSDAIKRVQLDISDDIQQRTDAMSIFRLKQQCYGGYQDKQTLDASSGFTVQFNISGMDTKK